MRLKQQCQDAKTKVDIPYLRSKRSRRGSTSCSTPTEVISHDARDRLTSSEHALMAAIPALVTGVRDKSSSYNKGRPEQEQYKQNKPHEQVLKLGNTAKSTSSVILVRERRKISSRESLARPLNPAGVSGVLDKSSSSNLQPRATRLIKFHQKYTKTLITQTLKPDLPVRVCQSQ